MVGFRRPRCTIHKKKKTSQAFWKRFFSCRSISRACDHPFYYRSKLFEKSHNPFSFYQYLYHYYLSIIILLHTRKKPDLPILLIYILLILLFLLHHNIDAFKRNDYYFAKTNKYQIFEQRPHMQKFCPRKESKQIIILTSLNLLKKP